MRFLTILLMVLMLSLFVGCKSNNSDTNATKDNGQSQSDELPVDDRDDDGWSQDVI